MLRILLLMTASLAFMFGLKAGNARAGEQMIFLFDSSSSMSQPAPKTGLSRYETALRATEKWVSHLPRNTRLGAVSIDGACGLFGLSGVPVGTDKSALLNFYSSRQPNGMTPLNRAMESLPQRFDLNKGDRLRAVLVSDGLNTCPPMKNSCEIARDLNRQYGIRFDVISFVDEPVLRCIANVSGGRFAVPENLAEWLSFLRFDWTRPILLALIIATLLVNAIIIYRHGFFALGWSGRTATAAALSLVVLGTSIAYAVLFLGQGFWGLVSGLVVIAAGIWFTIRTNAAQNTQPATDNSLEL